MADGLKILRKDRISTKTPKEDNCRNFPEFRIKPWIKHQTFASVLSRDSFSYRHPIGLNRQP